MNRMNENVGSNNLWLTTYIHLHRERPPYDVDLLTGQ